MFSIILEEEEEEEEQEGEKIGGERPRRTAESQRMDFSKSVVVSS